MTLFIRSFLWANIYFDKSPLKCHGTKRTPAVSTATPPLASWKCVFFFVLQAFLSARHFCRVRTLKPVYPLLQQIALDVSVLLTVRLQNNFFDAPRSSLQASQEWLWAWMAQPLFYPDICVNACLEDMAVHMWLNHTLFWYLSRMPVLSFNLRSLSNMLRLINYTKSPSFLFIKPEQ